MSVKLAAAAVFSVLLIVSAAAVRADSTMLDLEHLLLAEGAQDVVWQDRGNQRQLGYTIARPYPAAAIDELRWKELKERGWSKCSGGNEGWIHFSDISTEPPRAVYQNLSHWVNGDELLVIMFRYFSQWSGGTVSKQPDNDKQYVSVILAPFDEQVETMFNISCP